MAAAVERLGVRGWGVDASEQMLAKARERHVRGAAFKLAQADDLPFRDGWFDAVTMRLVVHTLGDRRAAALAEARRVLAAERPALRLDVRARALHGPPPGAVSARPGRRSTSRASRRPRC